MGKEITVSKPLATIHTETFAYYSRWALHPQTQRNLGIQDHLRGQYMLQLRYSWVSLQSKDRNVYEQSHHRFRSPRLLALLLNLCAAGCIH